MTGSAYITSVGAFLPGDPIGNDELEIYLGTIPGSSDRLRRRMLEANGIEKRHYAIDRTGQTTILNEEMAAHARVRIGRDLHDSAIQPYLGLRYAIEALPLFGRRVRIVVPRSPLPTVFR